jgi:hypothetical protein
MMYLIKPAAHVLLIFFCTLTINSAWAERVLLQNADSSVTVPEPFFCNRTIDLRIDSDSPDIFNRDSVRMQALIDSTQAMLRYECPGLQDVRLSGFLRGLEKQVYSASANSSNRWKVSAKSTLGAKELEALDRQTESTLNRQHTLATMQLDLSVDEVKQKVENVFGTAPAYDYATGLMNLELGGCPRDYLDGNNFSEASAEWVCLKAWFTDKRIATLYKLNYLQVVKGSMQDVQNTLIEKFGSPAKDIAGGKSKTTKMVWRAESVGADNQPHNEEVEANLTRIGDHIIVDMILHDVGSSERPGKVTESPERVQARSPVRLKL